MQNSRGMVRRGARRLVKVGGGRRRHEGTKARRHEGTQARSGDQAERERVRMRSPHVIRCCLRHHFVPSCLSAFVPSVHSPPLRKTGGVMRFGEHFCAARFCKSGKCRGICGEIVLDFFCEAVGFLVMEAQRALGARWERRFTWTERQTSARFRTRGGDWEWRAEIVAADWRRAGARTEMVMRWIRFGGKRSTTKKILFYQDRSALIRAASLRIAAGRSRGLETSTGVRQCSGVRGADGGPCADAPRKRGG